MSELAEAFRERGKGWAEEREEIVRFYEDKLDKKKSKLKATRESLVEQGAANKLELIQLQDQIALL